MIYGANGFTAQLMIEVAKARGLQPILAGRSMDKIGPIAERHGLETRIFSLNNKLQSQEALKYIDLVVNAAGPFIYTANAMRQACLATQTHYLDITGELPVFKETYAQDDAAQGAGCTLISGMGFDIVPSDCLASYVINKVNSPVAVDVAISGTGGKPSAGTLKTVIELIDEKPSYLRKGKYMHYNLGSGGRWVPYPNRELFAIPVPLGDLAAIQHQHGIPNVTGYMSLAPKTAKRLQQFGAFAQTLMKSDLLKRITQKVVAERAKGPGEQLRKTGQTFFWAEARNAAGDVFSAGLQSVEGYRMTAECTINGVQRLLADDWKHFGALSPSQAFGADFILELDNTVRYDNMKLDKHRESATE